MHKVYVLSGPSGCGKSTFAKDLADKEAAVVCSADDFFTDDEGNYLYDPAKSREAHSHCFAKFVENLQYDLPIVVDNTNLEWWERQNYIKVAEMAGRKVEVHAWRVIEVRHIFELAGRNKHGVTAELIFKMVARQSIDANSFIHTIDERTNDWNAASGQPVIDANPVHGSSETDSPYIVVCGNPLDGLQVVGPFEHLESAQDEGEWRQDGDWWTTRLCAPRRRN